MTATVAQAQKITVTVLASDKIEVRQNCEYAAWYTLWRVLPGTYELTRVVDQTWPSSGRGVYFAQADAEVVEDYYASHLGGVAVGNYDIHQNKGKRGKVTLRFTPQQVLKHQAVAVPAGLEDALLDEAMAWLSRDADCYFRCLRDSMGVELGGRERQLEWADGHAAALAKVTALYKDLYYIKARRDCHRGYERRGDTRYIASYGAADDIHAERDNRDFVAQA